MEDQKCLSHVEQALHVGRRRCVRDAGLGHDAPRLCGWQPSTRIFSIKWGKASIMNLSF
jgi:hypothetical protein